MSLDHHFRGGPLLQPFDVTLQDAPGLLGQVAGIERKEDVAERLLAIELLERLRAEGLLLGRRRGWRGLRRGRWRGRRSWSRGWRRRGWRRGSRRRRLGFRIAVTSGSAQRGHQDQSGAQIESANHQLISPPRLAKGSPRGD